MAASALASSYERDFGSIRDKEDIIHLCIPMVDLSITQEYISSKLGSLGLGIIKRIQFSPNKESEYKKAIVYFDSWVENERTSKIIESLKQTGCLSIVYDFPKIWKCRIFNPNINERVYNVSASRYVALPVVDVMAAAAATPDSPPFSGAGAEKETVTIEDKHSVASSNKSFDFSSLTPTNPRRRQYVPAPNSSRASPPRTQYRAVWQ